MAITILGSTSSGGGSSTPVVQTLPNNDATIAAGTTVARIPALSSSRFYNLPLASGYANGSTLTILDSAGSLSASVVASISSATDIINGANPLILSTPYASPVLISNGVDKWTLDIRGVSRGGTGATDAAAARTNLGLGTGNTLALTGLTLGTSGNLFGGTNLIEQRNGTNAQAFRVYNTLPSSGSTAGEWFEVDWQSTFNTVKIGPNKGVTGNRRAFNLCIDGNAYFGLSKDGASSGAWWCIATSGHLITNSHNTYDIGAAGGVNCPRNIYVAGLGTFGGTVTTGGSLILGNSAGTISLSGALINIGAGATTGILLAPGGTPTMHLGGTTSAFPAIKRNGTGIDIVLANDSGFAPIKGKITTDTAYTATVVAATGYITIYDSTGTAYRVPCAV